MSNQEIISQLHYRCARIKELVPVQTHQDAKDLLKNELVYIETLIEYRIKHDGLHNLITSAFSR